MSHHDPLDLADAEILKLKETIGVLLDAIEPFAYAYNGVFDKSKLEEQRYVRLDSRNSVKFDDFRKAAEAFSPHAASYYGMPEGQE
jgi:hypothetical protein